MASEVERLAESERAVLLTPCVCGHDLNDHGELAGCWACPEDNRECSVSFETLLTQHMATILDARSAAHDAEVAARAWGEGWNARARGEFWQTNPYARAGESGEGER